MQSVDPTAPDPGTYLWQLYNKNGRGVGGFQGYNPNSSGVSVDGDPLVNELTDKLTQEFDEKKRMALVFEFTRHHAKMSYRPKLGGGSTTIVTTWPALENQRVWLGDTLKRDWAWEWLNVDKAPLKK
jgi:ABC-type transport system substrate-binding protein